MTSQRHSAPPTHARSGEFVDLPRFEIAAPLGTGGQARVFAARDLAREGRRVALKVVPRGDDQKRERALLDEFFIMKRAQHPCVAQVYDAGISRDHVWIALELVPGRSLDHAVDDRHFTLADRLRAVADMGRGLGHIHGLGIVHCDLKPSNVLFGQDGRIRLIDFGIAKVYGRLSPEGLGTPLYVAPEVITEDRRDARSDIFAIGVILYELLTGRHPWVSGPTDRMTILHTMVSRAPTPLLTTETLPWLVLPDLARFRLSAIINHALHPEPARRFSTAHQLTQAVEEALLTG